MKHYILSIISVLLCITSCTSDLNEDVITTDGMHTYRMHLEGGIGSYSDEPSSRAAMTIADGTKLYLNLDGKTGTAVYHSSQNEWSLTYTGSLSGSGKCAAYYMPGGTENNGVVTLTPTSAVYGTDSGTYTCASDGSITVKATLSPLVSRFRLKGANGTQVQVTGVRVVSTFSLATKSFNSNTPESIFATVGSNGYSQHIYYYGTQPETLSIISGSKMFSIKTPLKDNGKSIYLDIPTEAKHNGWTMTDKPAGPEAVDLGLSVKWATFNVGANAPEDYGDNYAWGETKPKSNYSWSTYKWCNGSSTTMYKYCTNANYGTVDNKTVLAPEDDVAHVKWGGGWRMPTKAEQDELREKCTWTWTTQNGVKGCKVTSKTNGKFIFLPATGGSYDSILLDVGSWGYYWSSSLSSGSSDYACSLYFSSGSFGRSNDNRCYGRSVRAVCP